MSKKKCSNYQTIALISHASKVMLKIFQVRLQQNMNQELPDVEVGLEKAAATAKSLQLYPTLCDPIDGSPPGFPIPGIL